MLLFYHTAANDNGVERGALLPCYNHNEVKHVPHAAEVGVLVKHETERNDFKDTLDGKDAHEIGLRVFLKMMSQNWASGFHPHMRVGGLGVLDPRRILNTLPRP